MPYNNIKHIIQGKIVDKFSFIPLPGIEVLFNYKEKILSTKTDNDGSYQLEIELEYYNDELTSKPLYLNFKDPNNVYSDSKISILNKNNEVKKEVLFTLLVNSEFNLKSNIDNFKSNVITTLNKTEIKNRIPKSPQESLINYAKKTIIQISKTLIPSILSMLAAFSITNINNISEVENSICPSNDRLSKLIKKRNKLVRILNNIYKVLNVLSIAAGFVGGLITLIQIAKNVLVALPLPSPPKIPNLILELDKKLSRFRSNNNTLFIVIFVLRESLGNVINLLNNLDTQIRKCSSDTFLEELNKDLREINNEEQEDNIDSPISINGFKLEVQEIDKNEISKLKRRQAVAINPQGVIVLKGEPSFSSSDNVLINQLAFYIQSNNLKAF